MVAAKGAGDAERSGSSAERGVCAGRGEARAVEPDRGAEGTDQLHHQLHGQRHPAAHHQRQITRDGVGPGGSAGTALAASGETRPGCPRKGRHALCTHTTQVNRHTYGFQGSALVI